MTLGGRETIVVRRWEVVMDRASSVRFVCNDPGHLRLGVNVPEAQGFLTIHKDQWAYCSAALPDAPHRWQEVPATQMFELRHGRLLRQFSDTT